MSRLVGRALVVGLSVTAPARAEVITESNEQVLALGDDHGRSPWCRSRCTINAMRADSLPTLVHIVDRLGARARCTRK